MLEYWMTAEQSVKVLRKLRLISKAEAKAVKRLLRGELAEEETRTPEMWQVLSAVHLMQARPASLFLQ